jgi:beta-ribofuranosylaminobenzene 5'-phosphate synthase
MSKPVVGVAMSKHAQVQSHGRLHMGFFDLHGGLGRKFGSIGLTLQAPALQLQACEAQQLAVTAADAVPTSVVAKVATVAEQILSKFNLAGLALNVQQYIPEHAGLGSGTQIALAVGTAINHLFQLGLTTQQIAVMTARGKRSGIGIAAFEYGGLVIDGGRSTHRDLHTIPPLLARYAFPETWRILLIFDNSQPGVHGQQELLAFNALPVFPESLAAHLCRQVLMQAMPAMVEKDLTAFGQSIQVLQQHVGDYFAPVQGGRYASKAVGEVLDYLQNTGLACFGQSSWGPTGFAIFETEQAAQQQLQLLKNKFTDSNLSWQLCQACNTGAQISVI